jgi:hypothetical protein
MVICKDDQEIGQLSQSLESLNAGAEKFLGLYATKSLTQPETMKFGATVKLFVASTSATCSRYKMTMAISEGQQQQVPYVDEELSEMLASVRSAMAEIEAQIEELEQRHH